MPGDFIPAHGGQLHELAANFGVTEASLLDFSASINPLPPSDALVESLCYKLRARTILTTYPEMHYTALKQAIAKYVQVDPSMIAIGNGVMPLLGAAARALGLRKCLVPVPSFIEYPRVLGACGTERSILKGRQEDEFAIDAGRVISELKTTRAQAVLLANPQSPTGRLMSARELGQLHEEVFALGMTTIVDEAFVDYAPEASLSRTAGRSRGLIVLRSLTKFFSMPGLRVAYAIVHPQLRAEMEACIPAWPVDTIAAEAARLALADGDWIAAARDANERERNWLEDALKSLGLKIFPSRANYLLMKIDESRNGLDMWRQLIVEYRIVIRACANFVGLDEQYFRVGVRTRPSNQYLVEALAELFVSR